MPPWVRHSRLQTQQELCAKRFLRFASLHHVHAALLLWSLALLCIGVPLSLAAAPVCYFTAPVVVAAYLLPVRSLEWLSVVVLVMNALNAVHLTVLCGTQGKLVLFSPLFAAVPLSRVLFGLFTQEVHFHLLFSSMLMLLTLYFNREVLEGLEATSVLMSVLVLELIAVVVLTEGPCGYEEAIMHLSQCRAQHQLMRSQAVQRIDLEREAFSSQLLTLATQGIAELTGSVQRASEPVLNMLKSSCATGTKSASEVERIGRIGEALKEEVAEILRFKTQTSWARLQEQAHERTKHLLEFAAEEQAASHATIQSIRQSMGRTLAQMHEMELEAEKSLEQLIQGEINRAMETADARMDLVRQSAEAMERRVADTVEVLLSLLKYFRSKGGPNLDVVAPTAASHRSSRPRDTAELRHLPAIPEAARQPAETKVRLPSPEPTEVNEDGEEMVVAEETGRSIEQENQGLEAQQDAPPTDCHGAIPASSHFAPLWRGGSSPGGSTVDDVASDVGSGSATAGDIPEVSGASASKGSWVSPFRPELLSNMGGTDDPHGKCSFERPEGPSADAKVDIGAGLRVTRDALEKHPLFASRLSYRSDNFFWSWASSRDFRAEADSLWMWQHVDRTGDSEANKKSRTPSDWLHGSRNSASLQRRSQHLAQLQKRASADVEVRYPTEVYIDLSSVDRNTGPKPLLTPGTRPAQAANVENDDDEGLDDDDDVEELVLDA